MSIVFKMRVQLVHATTGFSTSRGEPPTAYRDFGATGSVAAVAVILQDPERRAPSPQPTSRASPRPIKAKRLALKKAYSREEIASEVGVTTMTINHWLTGYSLMAQRGNIERLKKFLAIH